MRVLITGCSGFLGPFLVDHLTGTGKDMEIAGITEVRDYESPKIKVFHVDIRNREAVFSAVEEVKPELTFHLAAISNVGFSWEHQKLTYEINFIGSSNLFEALSECSPGSRVLLMSSAELYGRSVKDLMDETTPTSARNPYALSKKAMEMLGDIYAEAGKLDVIKVRSFNFTGPGQDRKFVASDFSYQIAQIEKGKRKPVMHVGNLSAVRDISDVRDIARYLTVIAEKGENRGVYNLCSGKTYSIQDVLDILLSLSTEKIAVMVDPDKFRPIDVPRLAGDNRRIRESFGLQAEYKIQKTLSDLLNYWRKKVGD